MRAAVLVCALLLAPALVGTPGVAQAADSGVSSRRVEAGQPFSYEIAVGEGTASVANARLAVPPGVTAQGPIPSTRTSAQLVNGRWQSSVSVSLRWTLVAAEPGKYRIGPGSFEVGGKVERGQAFTVEVVPATQRRRGFPFDFFDMPPLGGLPMPGFEPPESAEPEPPSHPPEYAVEKAPDPTAFVLTKASPTRVVIGEAVRADVIAYGGLGNYLASESSEPSREGFLAFRVTDNTPAYLVPSSGRDYVAKRVHALVLFPVQTGSLKIGSSSFEFKGGEYGRRGASIKRESQPVTIIVTEPPVAGRPPGYRIGDVGRYELTASVELRSVSEGAAVSVFAKLEGTGNVPTRIVTPGQKGVEWLEPTTTENLEVTNDKVQGYRTFTYVVKLDRAGEIDLGELTLPYWDPGKRAYAVARAGLGKVVVKPDPKARAEKAAAEPADSLKDLLPARSSFGKAVEAPSYLADRKEFWAALAFGPLAVLAASGAARGGRRLLERRRSFKDRPAERALGELDRARTARGRDPALAAGSSERAVLLAIEAATGLKARGVLRSELGRELAARGVSAELAQEIVTLLDRCEDVRFSTPSSEAADLTVEAAERIVHAFTRGKWKA